MVFGLERVLTPGSALLLLASLADELDPEYRHLLAQTLAAMFHHGSPDRARGIASEQGAVAAAMPFLAVEAVS